MNHDRGYAVEMSLRDMLDPLNVSHHARAFIVDDHIEPFRPIRLFVNAELGFFRVRSAFVDDGPGYIGARTDAFGQNHLLPIIIVATSARDQQGTYWFGCPADCAWQKDNCQ